MLPSAVTRVSLMAILTALISYMQEISGLWNALDYIIFSIIIWHTSETCYRIVAVKRIVL